MWHALNLCIDNHRLSLRISSSRSLPYSMTSFPQSPPQDDPVDQDPVDIEALILGLRRKQGDWLSWGSACQTLQKTGLSPQKIFEDTGFEPIQQNQVIVAAQVYQSIVAAGVEEAVRSHFNHKGSDILYELRILSQSDRARGAMLAHQHSLDSDQIRDIVKALKEYSYRKEPPEYFSDHPGDAVAYHYWSLARQQSDLQSRSRLIAQALRYAHSPSARQAIEKLLTDFTLVKTKPAPRLPFYRLESDTELPYLLPVAGIWPLTVADYKAVPVTVTEAPFGMVTFSGTGAWVPIPGWQVIVRAEDALAILARVQQLPNVPTDAPNEPILIVIDRAQRTWDSDSYFVLDDGDVLVMQWFAEAPSQPLLGRVILLLRAKRVLDEDYTSELWQVDE
jgi:Rubisco Assembly chaperone C-terminal domain/Rubisco accumulation factor 1 alpha helical domain/Rubisco accumulation factor 1 helix turn helix domain